MTFTEFLEFRIINLENYQLTVADLAVAILIILITRFLYWVFARLITRRFARQSREDHGRLFAVRQISKYVIYVVGVLLAIQSLGVQLSVLWASAAALLVGFGLGMQQTFNDLVSGIILLIEGTVDVGDVVILDNGIVGRVIQIGIRTSKVMTRDDNHILVPNSQLVVDKVHNLTYDKEPTRFQVHVGVAYGSDVEKVTRLLLKAAEIHSDVVDSPEPHVHFMNFGNSSLDFVLHFYSRQFMRIPRVQSELRYTIDQFFRAEGVTIPFPQRDVWMRQAPDGEA